jgi:spore coat polysaccharide biosynthesis protein SpsF
VRECWRAAIVYFRGPERDALDRYYKAPHACNAGAAVRITFDCPWIDPEPVDETIRILEDQQADYASNVYHAGAGSGLAGLGNRDDIDYSQYRWTLDTVEDLELLHAVYEKLGNRDDFGWREVLALMEREPELDEMNAHVVQKPLRQL